MIIIFWSELINSNQGKKCARAGDVGALLLQRDCHGCCSVVERVKAYSPSDYNLDRSPSLSYTFSRSLNRSRQENARIGLHGTITHYSKQNYRTFDLLHKSIINLSTKC